MRDLNYFEPYIAEQRGAEKKQKTILVVILILTIGVITFPVINFIRINSMENDIAAINTILDDPDAVVQMQRVTDKRDLVNTLENQLKLLVNIDQGIENIDVINSLIINGIMATIPEDLFLKSMSVTSDNIIILGSAKDKGTIAEFEYNLRLTEAFEGIFIPSITINEGIYDFTIQFKVKDVNQDETN